MAGLFDGVGQSFLTGRAIGRGIRTAVNDRRVRKSVEQFDDLEAQAAAADAAGDAAAAEELRSQSTALARKAFKSADKLEGLVGEGAGREAISRGVMGRKTVPSAQNPNDPYANTRANLDFTERLSNRAGRDIDPGQREEVAARAADYIYGNQVVPAKEAAQKEFAKNGKMSAETADRLVAGLTTLTMYMPQYKGAVIRVNPADNSIFIDRTGGDASDGETISSLEHLQAMDDLFSEAKVKPSTALATNMDARQKAQAAQDAKVAEIGKAFVTSALKVLEGSFKGPQEVSLAGQQASQKLATAGIKQAPLSLDSAGLYEAANPGVKFDSLMTMSDGRTYALGTSGVAAESGDVLPTAFIYDVTNRVAVSPDDWQRMQSQTNTPVTTSDLSALIALNRGLSNEARTEAYSLFNQAAMSYASGKLPQLSAPAEEPAPTAIAPRGASPSTRGGKRGKGVLAPETDDYINKITTNVTSPAYVAKHGKPPEGDARALAEWALPALVQQESGGDPNAVSPVGARGTYQIMPDTAANPGYGITPIADWNNASQAEQREFAIQYLTKGIEKGGSLAAGLAFYNGGDRQLRNLLGGAASGERMASAIQRPAPVPRDETGWTNVPERTGVVPGSLREGLETIPGRIQVWADRQTGANSHPVAPSADYLRELTGFN